jgi:hypothetical protein
VNHLTANSFRVSHNKDSSPVFDFISSFFNSPSQLSKDFNWQQQNVFLSEEEAPPHGTWWIEGGVVKSNDQRRQDTTHIQRQIMVATFGANNHLYFESTSKTKSQ